MKNNQGQTLRDYYATGFDVDTGEILILVSQIQAQLVSTVRYS